MLRTSAAGADMPTIRDLVRAIAERDGVAAAVVVGRDGLLIEAQTTNGVDTEHLAALAPPVISAAEALSSSANLGEAVTAILEFEGGAALLSALSRDTLLVVVVHQTANIGSLLYDLRRHRANMASLV